MALAEDELQYATGRLGLQLTSHHSWFEKQPVNQVTIYCVKGRNGLVIHIEASLRQENKEYKL